MSTTLKVAAYRAEIDRLFRLANVDYHACVSAGEIQNWQMIARRGLSDSADITCPRSNDYDKDQFRQAVACVKETLNRSDERIHQLLQVRP